MYDIKSVLIKKGNIREVATKKWACETTLLKCMENPNKDPIDNIEDKMFEFATFSRIAQCKENISICNFAIDGLEDLEKEYYKLTK